MRRDINAGVLIAVVGLLPSSLTMLSSVGKHLSSLVKFMNNKNVPFLFAQNVKWNHALKSCEATNSFCSMCAFGNRRQCTNAVTSNRIDAFDLLRFQQQCFSKSNCVFGKRHVSTVCSRASVPHCFFDHIARCISSSVREHQMNMDDYGVGR